MKQHSIGNRFMIEMLVGAMLACGALAEESQTTPPPPAAPATPELKRSDTVTTNDASGKRDEGKRERKAGAILKASAGVNEVMQMIQAGVSTEVIKAYIESSSIPYKLTATDIITLKNRGVPDELTTAMLKRGAAPAAQVVQSPALNPAPPADAGGPRYYGGLDPEGYDYFQYYYLYPRTLAAANQRLFAPYPSYSTFGSYPYGYFGSLPFHPLPPSAFRHP
jgi:hypothetical protein